MLVLFPCRDVYSPFCLFLLGRHLDSTLDLTVPRTPKISRKEERVEGDTQRGQIDPIVV